MLAIWVGVIQYRVDITGKLALCCSELNCVKGEEVSASGGLATTALGALDVEPHHPWVMAEPPFLCMRLKACLPEMIEVLLKAESASMLGYISLAWASLLNPIHYPHSVFRPEQEVDLDSVLALTAVDSTTLNATDLELVSEICAISTEFAFNESSIYEGYVLSYYWYSRAGN